MTKPAHSEGGLPVRSPNPWAGLAQVVLPMLAAAVGAVVAVLSLSIHWYLSDHNWRSPRYSWEHGNQLLGIVDAFVVMVVGAILFGRLSQLVVGLIARIFRRSVPLGRVTRRDLWFIVLPLLVWMYLAYVTNFDGSPSAARRAC